MDNLPAKILDERRQSVPKSREERRKSTWLVESWSCTHGNQLLHKHAASQHGPWSCTVYEHDLYYMNSCESRFAVTRPTPTSYIMHVQMPVLPRSEHLTARVWRAKRVKIISTYSINLFDKFDNLCDIR